MVIALLDVCVTMVGLLVTVDGGEVEVYEATINR